jgi:acyl-CoA dehydrogenase
MYHSPLKDMRFVMHEVLGDAALQQWYGDVDYSGELADSVLDEAARFGEQVLEPINKSGDLEGAHWTPEGVQVPAGFKEAYQAYIEGGWTQLSVPVADGGQGMPQLLNSAVEEIFFAANMAFYLGTSLARGAVEAITASASAEIQQLVLPKLVSGEWMGTMNLTEPQAGSDLALLRSRAVPEGDHYRLYGQKIFITYGDHQMTDNIVHLVLARIDGAPAGTRGISMFLVPKRLINADGSSGEPNDVRCLSIEHKMGIHASPTCVMAFGEKQGALGMLLGAPNSGLAHMFIMMNAARLSVGGQGLAQSERALQQALEWARNRVQGKLAGADAAAGPVAIVNHPDVKRMLLSMKARTEAMRLLVYTAGLALDEAHHEPDAARRAAALARAELLTPVVKGWCTETAVDVTSTGVQVHGGMGYVEETGAAQFLRDVRIAAIYEGTTGIQANDLIGRKLQRDKGAAMASLIADLRAKLAAATAQTPGVAAAGDALQQLEEATAALLQLQATAPEQALAVAVPYLQLVGLVVAGALMVHAADVAARALAAGAADAPFYQAKLVTVRFFAQQLLPAAAGWAQVVQSGGASVAEADAALF